VFDRGSNLKHIWSPSANSRPDQGGASHQDPAEPIPTLTRFGTSFRESGWHSFCRTFFFSCDGNVEKCLRSSLLLHFIRRSPQNETLWPWFDHSSKMALESRPYGVQVGQRGGNVLRRGKNILSEEEDRMVSQSNRSSKDFMVCQSGVWETSARQNLRMWDLARIESDRNKRWLEYTISEALIENCRRCSTVYKCTQPFTGKLSSYEITTIYSCSNLITSRFTYSPQDLD